MDEEGFIYIVDRLKDMIISGGENIYPAEVEKVIAGMPQVRQVAVIGTHDPKWGEVPMAIIVRNEQDLDANAVLEYCKDRMAGYKIPRTVTFMDSLPLTATGKVQKPILKKQISLGGLFEA
jgi:acyl-CoA synthetase (AMP-forming)/AMP-acid ligase II